MRLADGRHADGKLTVKSMAGVKTWVLTDKFTDLQDEFRAMVERVGAEPEPALRLQVQLAERDTHIVGLRSEIRELKADLSQLERVINVLLLENLQLRGETSRDVPDLNKERDKRGRN